MALSDIIIDPEGDLWISTQRLTLSEKQNEGKSHAADGSGATDDKETKVDKVNIKVSSKVLTLASPVFRILLTGWGKEAAEFAATKASSKPFTLDLPEDDPDAAALLFEILHHKPTKRSDDPSPSNLEKLAFISDKYQCSGAFRYCAAIWIRDWVPLFTEEFTQISCDLTSPRRVEYTDELKRLLVFAYVVDLPKEFNMLAWHLFLHNNGPLSAKTEEDRISLAEHPLLRHDVSGHIDMQRTELAKLYHAGLMAPISHNWETSGGYCSGATKVVAAYLKYLSASGVLPYDLEFSGHTFYQLLTIEYPVFKMEKCGKYCRGCAQDHSNPISTDLAMKLRDAVNMIKVMEDGVFICLDCIKSDGKTKECMKCTTFHL